MPYPTDHRWREILPALGVSPKLLNGKHHPCPACGGTDRFRFDNRKGTGSYFCNGCGSGNGYSLLMKVNGWTFEEAMQKANQLIGNTKPREPEVPVQKADPRLMLRQVYKASQPISNGDPVDRYLRNRGLEGHFQIAALRYVPELYHSESKSNHPGMIAMICDAEGKPKSMHRTYLTSDGQKAEVTPNRMFMPGGFPLGGAVRLGVASEVMGIAEGLETALAASLLYHIPVWAALSEIPLRNWTIPSIVKSIFVFGDNDANFVGQTAAYTLAKRLQNDDQELYVSVKIPDRVGEDWNDFLLVRKRESDTFVKGMANVAHAA